MKLKISVVMLAVICLFAPTAAQVDNCCFTGWQCNSDQDWIKGYHAHQAGHCAAPAQSQTGASSQIDNCCFAGWQCNSDQDWVNGYHAFLNGQCAAPAQPQTGASSQIDNCCFAGWQCNTDQDWVNGYVAFQKGQCPGSPGFNIGNFDSCCQLGWNCTLEEDQIFARWWHEHHGGHCYSPIQVSFDGLIVEGTRQIVDRVIASLNLLKTRAPQWYAYTRNALVKIRETDERVGTGVLGRTFNVLYNPLITDDIWKAGVFAHEACHVYRLYWGPYHYGTEEEQINEEAVCNYVQMHAVIAVDPEERYRAQFEQSMRNYYSLGYNFDAEGHGRVEVERAAASL